ncbi:MAG: YcgN family cysteine cluster protein [Pseudohongiellaceae bacterium]
MATLIDTTPKHGLRERFWELPLEALNQEEWEALCDGCGRCCLKKLSDEESDQLVWTRVVCRYYQESSSNCGCYSQRTEKVPDCIDVRNLDIAATQWMPETCAYQLRALDKPLFDWHPLIAGNRNLITSEGISIEGKVVSEDFVHPEGYEEHVIRWVNGDE